MKKIAKLTSLFVGIGLVAACHGASYPKVDPETGIPILTPNSVPESTTQSKRQALSVGPALEPAQSCEEVAELFRLEMIESVTAMLQSSFASDWRLRERCDEPCGIYGCGGYYSDGGVMSMADAGAVMSPSDPGAQEDGDDPEHSETNNQVAGVDEPDFVKTDGTFIYLLSGGSLRILRSWPAAATEQVAAVPVQGTPKKLFLHEDRVLIYASLDNGTGGAGSYGGGECTYGYDCVPTGDGFPTRITIYDVSNRAAPVLVREIEISSSLLAARRIGTAVHTVVTKASTAASFTGLSYYPDDLGQICDATKWEIYQAYVQLLDENIQKIMETPLSNIFPTMSDRVITATGSVEKASPLEGCQGLYRASINDGHQFTSIISLDISQPSAAAAVSILTRPGVVYASQDSLYLAVPRQRVDDWSWYADLEGEQEATTIQKFTLDSSPPGARYVASGLVKGRILNQFSLDEHEDHLRLATTSGHVGYNTEVHNTLTISTQQGQQLVPTGVLDQLAPTEDIRAVRFDGTMGYVVTFKKTDPLYVLDLADPTAPSVLGELKIPGFSTYMHKMDDTHLLTIGYDADDQGSFAWFTGVMLQIFDVSVPTSPQLKFKHVIGTRGSSSEALTNHLAFTYYAPKNLLALPMTVCEDSQGAGSYGMNMTFSGLMVFDVTAEDGFSQRGQIPFPVAEQGSSDPWGYNDMCSNWWTRASSEVQRSLIIDNFIYSISPSLLKVNDLDDLSVDLTALPLQ